MSYFEMTMMALLALLLYIYLGYPVLLCVLSKLFPRPHLIDAGYTPTVTLLISAYNEAAIIRTKIENSLALDYPADRLTIVVVSDCSDDGTDEEVLAYGDRGVLLVRATEHLGKTSALNQAMEGVTSDVVIFSDANALYDRSAIRFLTRHFADLAVGYVVGHARYKEETASAAGASEGAYWGLEVMVKQWESRFSSVVGGDGAIYGIRRTLYETLQLTDINDFVNPLQIVAKGYRGIFDAQAFCLEQPAGQFGKEFSRKVRIVNRSFNAIFRVPQVCNPLRTGRFAWQLVSHKVLRWLSPFILCLYLVALLADLVLHPASALTLLQGLAFASFLLLAAGGWLLDRMHRHPPMLFYLPYYFVLINVASIKGVLLRLRGTTITTWATVRHSDGAGPAIFSPVPTVVIFAAFSLLLLVSCNVNGSTTHLTLAASALILALLHAFVIYPGLLLPMGRLLCKPIARDDSYLPEVTLLIAAYNEEQVIEGKVLNTLALDYPQERLRVVVASDGSTDGTNDIVSRYACRGVELMAFPVNRGKMAALNEAMRSVRSPYVVFSDANVSYAADSVRKLVRNFADSRVGAVSGRVVLRNDALSYGAAEASYYDIEHRIHEREGRVGVLVGADGAMYAIRTSLFTPPSEDTILDDFVIAMAIARAGHLVVHDKEAVGHEENVTEVGGEFRRKVRIMAGGYQCLLRGGVLPRLSQPVLMFCFVSHKVLRWTSGLLLLSLFAVLVQITLLDGPPLFGVVLTGLAAGVLVAVLVQLFPSLKGVKAANFCHYFSMLMLASLVGCYLGVTGRQKVTWRGETG